MSAQHPIISITGSSGAGTTSVKAIFELIFRRENVVAAYIEGDAFHRYYRAAMKARIAEEAGAVAGARPRDAPRHAQQPPRRAMRHHNASANAASRATPVAPRALRGAAWQCRLCRRRAAGMGAGAALRWHGP